MDNKTKVISNLIWRFLERCGAQIVSMVVSILLARILDISEYGIVSKVLVITTILMVFVDSGMANALIQKKNPDDLDYSSVFYFNVSFCLVLYALLFLTAPLIARMYHDPDMVPVLRVLGLTVVVAGVKNVQQAYVSKTLQFKRFFFATLGGTLFSAVLGIAMARRGFGVWALVAQQLSNVTVNTVILWFTVGWRPRRMFSLERLKGLLSYGWKLLGASLLDTIYLKLYPLVIGIRYTNADLAFFDRGNHLPNLVVENINYSIDSVLLPVLSAEQDHADQVREMTRRAIKTSTYVMMPLMAGLAVCAEPLIRLLLTEKWLPSAAHGQPQRHQGYGPQRRVSEAGDHQEGAGDRRAAADHAPRRHGHGLWSALLEPGLPAYQRLAQQAPAELSLSPAAAGYGPGHPALAADGGLRVPGELAAAGRSAQAPDPGSAGRAGLCARLKAPASGQL